MIKPLGKLCRLIPATIMDTGTSNPIATALSEQEEAQLRQLAEGEAPKQVSRRAQALLLYFLIDLDIDEIARVCGVHENSIRNWLHAWRQEGIDGLYDRVGRGAKPIFSEAEEELIISYLEEEPRSLRKLAVIVEKRLKKSASTATLKRILKKHGKVWKRMRKTPKKRPEDEAVEQAKAEIAEYERQEAEGNLDIYYFDESGFSLQPSVPYAWQDKGRNGTLGIPSSRSERINVLSFLSPKKHDLIAFDHKGNVDSSVFIDAMDEFCNNIIKPTVVILDNASIHCSKEVEAMLGEWKKCGLELYRIPPYSPKLNLAEVLWRKMKYEWIPAWAYFGFDLLKRAIRLIILGYGEEYDIQFA